MIKANEQNSATAMEIKETASIGLLDAINALVESPDQELNQVIAGLKESGKLQVILVEGNFAEGKPEIWLSIWPESQSGEANILAQIHSYTDSEAAIHIYRGDVEEVIYNQRAGVSDQERQSSQSIPVSKISSFINQGSTLVIPPGYIHKIVKIDREKFLAVVQAFTKPSPQVRTFVEEGEGDDLHLRDSTT